VIEAQAADDLQVAGDLDLVLDVDRAEIELVGVVGVAGGVAEGYRD
jgi:hypothetical protein